MIRFMKKYIGFTRCAISRRLAYRSAQIMNILIAAVGLCVSLFLWNVLFKENAQINGYSFSDMIAYLIVAFVVKATLGFSTESEISNKVLDGSIASDLVKPIRFQNMCFFEAMGSAVVEIVIAATAGICLALVLLGTQSIDLIRFALLAVSLFLAFILKFCISYISGLVCFYTSNGYGVVAINQTISDIFSGALLPLSFYPGWFQTLAGLLPYQAAVYTPTQLFLGRIAGMDALVAILLQAAWIVALWLVGRFFFSRAVRKITVHGG